MLNRIRQLAQNRAHDLDRSEGGAILLLVLAGLLVLFLTSMIMFDAGQIAHQKIHAQNAADTAAYSQSVVKARSMNMIAYANTSKRMMMSYFITYTAAAEALALSTAQYCSSCNIFNWYACYRCFVGGLQGLAELINFFTNVWSTINRAQAEIETLDNYQAYLAGITPWWGYAENLFRGIQNGATVTAAWPRPGGSLPDWAETIMDLVLAFDNFFDTNLHNIFPNYTNVRDSLPASQRSSGGGDVIDYCAEFYLSLEHFTPAIEHILQSDGGGWDPRGISTDSQTRGIFLGLHNPVTFGINCGLAYALVGSEVLDYRVDGGGLFPGSMDEDEWMQKTSNLTFAYQNTRRSDERRARGFDTILPDFDHAESPLYQSDGTWSIARSELIWGQQGTAGATFDQLFNNAGAFSSMMNFASSLTAGPLVAARGGPNMWHPRWTARLRPVHLPGESLGTTAQGNEIGLDAAFFDSVGLMAASSMMTTVFDGSFDITTVIGDMFYMYAVGKGYSHENLQGLAQ